MLFEVQLAIGIASIVLAVILVALFFKVYWTQRQIFLLGLPLGFLLLTISYTFLVIHFLYPYAGGLSYSLMWLRVITQTSGFTLIAASYILARIKKSTKLGIPTISLILVLAAIIGFGLLDVINPPGLAIIYTLNNLFTVANIALLSYIIAFLVRNIRSSSDKHTGLLSAPIAFAVFWLGQLSFLIWEYTRSDALLLSSQICRVISLVIFIGIYYLASKEVSIDGNWQT